jgi:hypothetical protein
MCLIRMRSQVMAALIDRRPRRGAAVQDLSARKRYRLRLKK